MVYEEAGEVAAGGIKGGETIMFKITPDDFDCPPGCPEEFSPCTENADYCDDCIERFNDLPIDVRIWRYFKAWWKGEL